MDLHRLQQRVPVHAPQIGQGNAEIEHDNGAERYYVDIYIFEYVFLCGDEELGQYGS